MLTLITLVIVSLFTNVKAASNKKHDITYYTETYAPSSYYYNDKLVGLSVEMLKLIWRDQNIPEQPILVVPWARGYKEITNQQNVALFAMSKTKERAPLFKWVGPLFTAEYLLIAQPNTGLPFNSIEQAFDKSIVIVRDDVTEDLINQTNYPVNQIVSAKNVKDAIALFNAKRVDLLAISRSGLRSAVNQRLIGLTGFQQVMLLKSIDDYIAFSKDTSDEIIDAFQASLEKLSEEHQALKEEYNLH